MKRNLLILSLIIFLNEQKGLAWGSVGHKIIAQIARAELSQAVLDSVTYYLGETSFESASVWMDEIRSDQNYDYLKPMHYINVAKDQTYVPVKEPNIINELETILVELSQRSKHNKQDVKTSLLILFHLVGDLHQPLHSGYATDKGGNSIRVDFMGTNSNLHRVWDSNIIETQKISMTDCLQHIQGKKIVQKGLYEEVNILKWMNESRDYLNRVYEFKDNTIDLNYVLSNKSIIEKQLTLGGLRLAAILNQTFKAK